MFVVSHQQKVHPLLPPSPRNHRVKWGSTNSDDWTREGEGRYESGEKEKGGMRAERRRREI
jgi:hypothetical protein